MLYTLERFGNGKLIESTCRKRGGRTHGHTVGGA